MPDILWWFLYSFFWYLLGVVVLVSIDDDDQRLFEWAKKNPFGGSVVIAMLWPIILSVHFGLWLKYWLEDRGG